LDRGEPTASPAARAGLRADPHDPNGAQAPRHPDAGRFTVLGHQGPGRLPPGVFKPFVRSRTRTESVAAISSSRQTVIPIRPRPCRPFQGWRYLEPRDAPADFDQAFDDGPAMPEPLRRELATLGLL
jgi:hypothetical protein